MKYKFRNTDVATVAFYERDLMGAVYDPPGVTVYRDDDGVPWFEIRKELQDGFDADDRFERYRSENGNENESQTADNSAEVDSE